MKSLDKLAVEGEDAFDDDYMADNNGGYSITITMEAQYSIMKGKR